MGLCRKEGHRRVIDKCSLILTFLVIISLGLSVATLFLFLRNKTELERDYPAICVSCSDIKAASVIDSKTMELYDSLRKANEGQCCADDKTQTSAIVQLISKKLTRKQSAIALGQHMGHSLSTAFAQKSLSFLEEERIRTNVPRIDVNKRYFLTINDQRTDAQYELKHEVKLTPHGITIIHPGLYFVYKSINFLPDSNKPCKDFGEMTFKSYLVRNNSITSSDLLRNEHTCCPDCIHNSETGFSGGVFRLEKGDIIQVAVTSLGLIHVSKDVTYLGLMMMGEQN